MAWEFALATDVPEMGGDSSLSGSNTGSFHDDFGNPSDSALDLFEFGASELAGRTGASQTW
jgi:hypothetical protein